VSSIKDRQRAAARARLEKEMAERSLAARKRRQRQLVIGSAIAVVVIAGAAVWVVSTVGNNDKKSTASKQPAGTVACAWNKAPADPGSKVKDTGGMPPTNAANVGKATMAVDTNLGKITVAIDRSKVPCATAAFEYLASKGFWNNTKCHRLTTEGIKVLQCGDPFATGKGYRQTDGAGTANFQYAEENLPLGKDPTYPAGTIAMAKRQEPGTTSTQFFVVYEDIAATALPAQYTVLGTVTTGLDIVRKVAKAGTDNANQPGDGHPKMELDIKTLTVAAA
jgi:peptidyl-prolyl cis-trans isomerase B (cyclophilin B)